MKLLYYEYKKIYKKKMLMILTIVLFLISTIMFAGIQYSEDEIFMKYRQTYDLYHKEYQDRDPSDALEEIEKKQEIMDTSYEVNGVGAELDESLIKINIEKLKQSDPDRLDAYMNSIYYNNSENIRRDSFVFHHIGQECEAVQQYPIYIASMKEQADNMLEASIFNKPNTFAYRNIMETVKDFEGNENLELEIGNDRGFKAIFNYYIADLFVAIIVFLLCYYLFMEERENGLTQLLKANPKGRMQTVFSKVAVMHITIIGLVLIFYGTIMIMSGKIYGYGNLDRMVQSIGDFRECEMLISCGELLTIFLLTKMVGMILIGIIIGSICIVSGSSNKVYLATIIFFALSYGAYALIHPVSFLNPLKYINIMTLLNTFELYLKYNNINVFGYVFSKPTLIMYAVIIIYIVGSGVICLGYSNTSMSIRTKLSRWQFSIIPKNHTSLFMHELYKSFISGRGYILVIFAVIISYNSIEQGELLVGYDEHVYNEYLRELDGKTEEEQDKFIEDEKHKFDNIGALVQELDLKLEAKKITKEDWEYEIQVISDFTTRKAGFNNISKQYNHIKEIKDKGIDAKFVHNMTSDYMYDNKDRDLLNGIMYSVLLLICIGGIFTSDYVGNMNSVLRANREGRLKFCMYKYTIGYSYAILLLALIYIPYLMNVVGRYPQIDWNAPIQSIELMKDVAIPISIKWVVIASGIIKTIGALVLTTIIMTISQIAKKQSMTICISTSIVAIPMIIQLAGTEFIGSISFNRIFIPYEIYVSNSYLYIGIIILLGIIFMIMGINIHCNNEIGIKLSKRHNKIEINS